MIFMVRYYLDGKNDTDSSSSVAGMLKKLEKLNGAINFSIYELQENHPHIMQVNLVGEMGLSYDDVVEYFKNLPEESSPYA